MPHYSDQFANKKVLIIGAMGFIGSNLARRLVNLGAKVLLVDSMIPQYGGNVFNIDGIEEKVKVAASRNAITPTWTPSSKHSCWRRPF